MSTQQGALGDGDPGPGGELRLHREVAVLRHLAGLAVPEPLGSDPATGSGERFSYTGPRTLHDAGALDPTTLLSVLTDVVEVLAEAHDRGVSHGRLDPGHVLVGDDNRAVVTGWADAGLRDDVRAQLGTAAGPSPFDPSGDVAAFGALVEDTAHREALPAGRARTHLAAVATAARHPDPAVRPPARELLRVLSSVARSASEPQGATTPAPPEDSARRIGIAALAAAVAALLTVLAVTGRRVPVPSDTSSPVGPFSDDRWAADDLATDAEDAGQPALDSGIDPGAEAVPGRPEGPADTDVRAEPWTGTCPGSPDELARSGLPGRCRAAVRSQGAVLVVGSVRFAVGETGDVAGLSDPACSGLLRPTLLRPATGQVFVFDSWAAAGRPVSGRLLGTVPGAATLADPGGLTCGPVEVLLAGGSTVTIPGAQS